MCYKSGPLISPKHFEEFMLPNYKKVTNLIRSKGVDIVMVDTDGNGHNRAIHGRRSQLPLPPREVANPKRGARPLAPTSNTPKAISPAPRPAQSETATEVPPPHIPLLLPKH